MTARTRKFMKLANQFLYVLSIAMLISGSFLSAIAQPAAAATGSIWTTENTCGTQDKNQYVEGEGIYFNYNGLEFGNYSWQIAPTNDSSSPVATGSITVSSQTPPTCIYAFTFTVGTAGVYKLTVLDSTGGKVKSDNLTIVPAPVPGISLSKSGSPATYSAVGNIITYSFIVRNTGEVNLTGIVLSDPDVTSLSCPATALAVGAQMTCSGIHSISQADLDRGYFTNNASVTSAEVGPATATFTVNAVQNPSLSIVKTQTSSSPYKVGESVSYSIVATNTGNITLSSVTVSDPNAVLGSCSPSNPAALAPGGTITCSASHILTSAEVINAKSLTNTATATSGSLSVNSSVTTTFNPAMTFTKSVTSTGPYTIGSTVTYSLVVTNTGNVTLTWVTVTDPKVSNLVCSPVSTSTLVPGQVMNCTASHVITLADMDAGFYTNIATGDSNETSAIQRDATVGLTAGPAITFTKSVTSVGPYTLGSTIQYALTLQNIGNVTLTGITITDPGVVMGTCTPALAGLSLIPQASVTCVASHVVTLADMDAGSYTNTATGDSAQTPELTDSKTVELAQAPAMTIAKVATPGSYTLANSVPYTITVTNTGNITLHNVVVSDPSAVVGTCSPVAGSSLAPLASMECSATYVVTQTDMDLGHFTNISTANSTEAGPVTASATVDFTQEPNLSIVKSVTSVAPEAGYAFGETLTYSILLTNTGNITLHNVTIADLNADLGSCIPSAPAATLAVGGMITCAASHVIVQADLDAGLFENTAVGDSNETDQKQDSETVSFTPGPAISFEKKEVSQGPYFVGDSISYSLELTNIGNVTLHNVTIADPSAVFGTCTPAIPVASLLPLAKVTCAATHVVTAADITAGLTFMNTAVGASDETLPKNATVTTNLAIKGCMDPNATNYNPKATISDGSCTYPPAPTPTPTVVPTLPIPATGGEILIPVTGADLSNTLPGAALPRNLYFGGLSVFGVAMVLTGLRRKYHL